MSKVADIMINLLAMVFKHVLEKGKKSKEGGENAIWRRIDLEGDEKGMRWGKGEITNYTTLVQDLSLMFLSKIFTKSHLPNVA